ncbi:hypothetical protein, partial [Streptomyces sp. AK04-3B]|uniref:hypothetical protein n=1 Tax=Streptomyces sp. AK04-3B TaxID=3028650 RepID=UPI0029A45D65
MTATEQEPRTGRPSPPTAARWLTLLLVVFAVLVMSRSLSEGIYDIAFANLALDLSGLVSTVGLVYCVGYGVEVVASVAAGPLLDRGNPKTVLIVAYLVKIGVFVFIGIGSAFLSSHLWAIVVAAATVDLVHHIGEMALFVLLPRILDAKTLVRVQGIGGTIRSAAELLSPVVAGLVIALLPGSRALLVAAGLQAHQRAGTLRVVGGRARGTRLAGGCSEEAGENGQGEDREAGGAEESPGTAGQGED